MKTESEQIDDVIAFLESHKWIKYSMYEPQIFDFKKGPVGCCVFGAFTRINHKNQYETMPVWEKFNAWLSKQYPEYDKSTQGAVWYNDYVAKDKRYIIRKLRAFQRTL